MIEKRSEENGYKFKQGAINGVKGKIEATLTDEEVAKFKASAEALKAVIKIRKIKKETYVF